LKIIKIERGKKQNGKKMAKSMRMEDIIDCVTGDIDIEDEEECSNTDLEDKSEEEGLSEIDYSSSDENRERE